MWRLSSTDGVRWVSFDNGGITASHDGLLGVAGRYGPVEVVPMSGRMYYPVDGCDSVSVFLRARQVLGRGATVTGRAPQLPAGTAQPLPEGAVG